MKTMRDQNRSEKSNFSASRKLTVFLAFVVAVAAAALTHVRIPAAAASTISAANGSALTVPVDPTATFLHAAINGNQNQSDDPAMPAMVDLAAAGFAPGTEMKLSYLLAGRRQRRHVAL